MKNHLWIPFVFFCFSSVAAELVLSGSYQGKDIYVQNPYNIATSSFCTQSVFVNDREVFNQPKISAFKIDLSYLKINDLVVVRITYQEGCRPTVVNPHVIRAASVFSFVMAEADNNSITWSANGEGEGGHYLVEQQIEEENWKVVNSIEAKEESGNNGYTISAPHQKGVNHYRIKYKAKDGEQSYSIEFSYSKSDRITFHPAVATTRLLLSDTTVYFITDYYGREVKKGEGLEIYVSDLKPGEYYLNIQNRKEKFIKK